MRRVLLLLTALLALALAGCGDNESTNGASGTDTAAKTTGTDTSAAEPASGCTKVPAPKAKKAGKQRKPKKLLSRRKTWTAVVKTSCGTIEIRLDVKRSPKTASSFAALARSGFYDDLTFHRVVPGFVVQGGDPKGTGEGGPGYKVVEAPPKSTKYTKGVVAMAKTELEDPGTSGSQFFIVTAPDAGLPPDYAVVGKVVKGMDAVEALGNAPNDPNDNKPTQPLVIDDVTIREGS